MVEPKPNDAPAGSRRQSHAEAHATFDPAQVYAQLAGSIENGMNAAIECCDRHCGADRTALIWESHDGRSATYSFEQLRELSSKFANMLAAEGIGPGDRVAGLLPRTPELLITILGTWRAGAIYQPLFTAFGPKSIEHRLQTSRARLVVTDLANVAKLDEVDHRAAIITVTPEGQAAADGTRTFTAALEPHSTHFEPVLRGGDEPFLNMFTSGTTGQSKSVLVPLRAIPAFIGYMRDAIGLLPTDNFWNIADPGWAYGLYYAVTGPLAMGHATLFYDGPFTVESTVRIINDHQITCLAGAPTAFRLLISAGPEAVQDIKGKLRAVSSAGEALNPEVITWFAEHLDVTIHDHYGQTELGMVVANHHNLDHPVRAGSAGFALPGHRVVVVGEDGREHGPGEPGILAVDRTQSPLFWFSGYEGMATPSLGERYYLSGDTVELNDDGSISFLGRSDDVITSAGYRIGPFDVESALMEHSAVMEAAVVGKPDPERTELVKAFVVLNRGHEPTEELAEQLKQHVRRRLSAHAYPREVEFIDALPKTPSGKVQRFILRNQEISRTGSA